MTKSIDKFKILEKGIVTKILGEGAIRRRLFDMGLTPGAHVILRKRAPLGDPIEITVRNYELSLRKNEAENVICEVEETESNNSNKEVENA